MRARILNLTFGTHALKVKGQKATFLSLVACLLVMSSGLGDALGHHTDQTRPDRGGIKHRPDQTTGV